MLIVERFTRGTLITQALALLFSCLVRVGEVSSPRLVLQITVDQLRATCHGDTCQHGPGWRNADKFYPSCCPPLVMMT